MNHTSSAEDLVFRSSFERCELPPPFEHRDYIKLAYLYLTDHDVDSTHEAIESHS